MKTTDKKDITISFRTTAESLQLLSERAEQEERTISWLVNKAISNFLRGAKK